MMNGSKPLAWAARLACTLATPSVGASARPSDEAAVRGVVESVAKGWAAADPEMACGPYSTDAEWINAFGIERNGKDQICQFIRRVMHNPTRSGVHETKDEIRSVRLVARDVAVVHEYGETEGQKGVDGRELGTRKTHWLVVLKRAGSSWIIVSHLVMDVRSP
jgi:uncharacterized protein (TIGR02246 family)